MPPRSSLNRSQNWPYLLKAPTVNDLKNKQCWICLGDEDIADVAEGETPRLAKDRWIHACTCSLVSHESCLLTWIDNGDDNLSSAAKPAKCPQCGTRYAIKSHRSPLLRLINRGFTSLNSAYRYAGIGLGFGTVLLIGASYGGVVTRMFLGREAFHYYFGDSLYEWTLHSFEFAFVPITLAIDTSIFDAFLPLSTPIVLGTISRLTDRHFQIRLANPFRYPPSPSMMLFMWPYARMVHGSLWHLSYRLVTGKPYGTAGHLTGILRRNVEVLRVQQDEARDREVVIAETINNAEERIGEYEERIDADALERLQKAHNEGARASEADVTAAESAVVELEEVTRLLETVVVGNARVGQEGGAAPAGAQQQQQDQDEEDDHAVVVEVIQIEEPARPANAPANPNAGAAAAPNANANNRNDEGVANRIFNVTLTVIIKNVVSTLIVTPVMGTLVGSALTYWASQENYIGSGFWWNVLGMDYSPSGSGLRGSRNEEGLLRRVFGAPLWPRYGAGDEGKMVVQGLSLYSDIDDMDPVWWRNAVGTATYIFLSDAFSLLHIWLSLRERRSRRLVSRTFRGVDYAGLDLKTVSRRASAGVSASAPEPAPESTPAPTVDPSTLTEASTENEASTRSVSGMTTATSSVSELEPESPWTTMSETLEPRE